MQPTTELHHRFDDGNQRTNLLRFHARRFGELMSRLSTAQLAWRGFCAIAVIGIAIILAASRGGALMSCFFLTVAAGGLYLGRLFASAPIRPVDSDLSLLLESIPGMVLVNGPNGELEYVNRQVLDYVGKSFDDLKSSRWAGVIYPEDYERIVNAWHHARQANQTMTIAFRLRHFDGTYRWFKSRNQPLLNGNGKAIRWYALIFDIDQRKRAEDALRESERQLHQFIETIPALVWRATPEGQLDYGNSRLLDYTGKSSVALCSGGWEALIHPSEVEQAVHRWFESIRSGRSFECIFRIRRADGEFRWIQSVGEPFRDADGQITHWFGLLLDIDEQTKAEQTIRDGEQQLRLIVETIPALVWRAKPNGTIDYVNRRVSEYTGMSEIDLVNSLLLASVHPDDAETNLGMWQHDCNYGTSHETSYRLLRADGEYRWFQVRAEPLCDDDGNVISWYGVLLDIDDRRKAEDALRASERELRLIAETIPAILTTRTANGALDYVNQHLVEYTGKSPSELVHTGFNLVHPDDREQFLRIWRQSIQNGKPYRIDHRLQRADGAYRWFRALGEPLRDGAGKVLRWYDLLIDIDESKSMETALRNTQARLAHTSQIMAVAELSASIAHEINQPLAAVVANGRACQTWLTNSPPNIERARLVAERIVRDGEGAAAVVRRIRALFKQTAPAKERLNLNGLIMEVHRLMMDDFINKPVTVSLELDGDLPLAMVDRIQIQQVIINLLRNSLDATDSLNASAAPILIRTRHDEREIVVEVCDQGTGIPEPDRVFDPFFTTKNGGMGMGLAISKSIVEAHEGRLWAARNQPRGTKMTFALPTDDASQ